MDYHIISASEVNPKYRSFCEANYPGRIAHFFSSIQDQVKGDGHQCNTCEVTKNTFGCHPKGEMAEGREVNLMCTGSPCDPFSMQRSKRWSDGVAVHSQFDLTMGYVIDLYKLYEPRAGVFEQVHGFTLPFDKGGTETPKERHRVAAMGGWLFDLISQHGSFLAGDHDNPLSNRSIGLIVILLIRPDPHRWWWWWLCWCWWCWCWKTMYMF